MFRLQKSHPLSIWMGYKQILAGILNAAFDLTCDCELPLSADGGSVVAGDAGVVAVVLERHLGDLQGAHELLGVDGDARRGHDLLAVLAPRDAYGHVARRHHAGDVHQLADGRWWEVERLDERWNCEGRNKFQSKGEGKRRYANEVEVKCKLQNKRWKDCKRKDIKKSGVRINALNAKRLVTRHNAPFILPYYNCLYPFDLQ